MPSVTEGVEWTNVYFIRGGAPKYWSIRYAISDPPTSGWGLVFVLPGEKRSTIFCPYTFRAYTVPNTCGELQGAKDPRDEFRPDRMRQIMEARWKEYQALGFQRDYDTCALVMRRLGWEVPLQVMTGGEEDVRKRGGKETGTRLLKPVKAGSKRGKFLQWFLDSEGSRSVRETMAEFGMTRSNALSYLYMLQKDHGIGYVLVGDIASVTLPDGCTDPFNEVQPKTPAAPVEEAPDDDDDDSWLD